jgi:hypothetical protein
MVGRLAVRSGTSVDWNILSATRASVLATRVIRFSTGTFTGTLPALADAGKPPLRLDSKPATIPLNDYFKNENRFMKLERSDPEHSATLLAGAEAEAHRRRAMFEGLAQIMPVVVEEETVEVEAEASPAAAAE